VITQLHPCSSDRAEARTYGLCWHPTVWESTWACYEPPTEPPKPPRQPVRTEVAPLPIPAEAAREVAVTFREHDVAHELFKTGGTNMQIARQLCVSEDTVKTHMKRLLERTGSATRSELLVAHFRGRIRLIAKSQVGESGMIKGRKAKEDAL